MKKKKVLQTTQCSKKKNTRKEAHSSAETQKATKTKAHLRNKKYVETRTRRIVTQDMQKHTHIGKGTLA